MIPRALVVSTALVAFAFATASAAPMAADPATTRVTIDAVASLHRFHGHVVSPAVEAELDETGRPTRGTFRCSWNAVTTDHEERDSQMLAWAEALKLPDIVYVMDSMEGTEGDVVLVGSLTLHGQTLPLRLPARLVLDDAGSHLDGEVTLDHRAFGLQQFRKFGVLTVNPMVHLTWHVDFPRPAVATSTAP